MRWGQVFVELALLIVGILAGRVWYRGIVSEAAMLQSQQMAAEICAVRQEIQAELSTRRWP
jgi:hypothetical protein